MKINMFVALMVVLLTKLAVAAPTFEILNTVINDSQSLVIAGSSGVVTIAVDAQDNPVVKLAADLFADDVDRVTGQRPKVTHKPDAPQMIIAGTLGHSDFIDKLAADGKLKDLDKIRGRWEATLWQIVDKPFPQVERALVIAGSDRRGTAYGLMLLSEKIGVSPWYWWADVPVRRWDTLAIKISSPQTDAPGVKYRGIFINDEDFGLYPWVKNTFDPDFNNIGPKTYEKVFELLLRLRLNYIWPAMHEISREFGSVPDNVKLADKYAIVAGASHCEPMLCNNANWDEKTRGRWDYTLNRDTIHSYWKEMVKARGDKEAVWTLGMRGIHDRAMQGPKDILTRIKILTEVIKDQRALLDQYVTNEWGPVAQCFVPYKEVQPLYDAGLKVPPDVTLVWADDNFGYVRRLSAPEERKRPGGSGVYYHISYWGRPHSYLWINTTAPALIWEELHKAWENEARTLWVVNVGDIKPAEIGVDFLAHLAWNPQAFGPDSQPHFLREFAAKNFGEKSAQPIADFLAEFYRLGTIRKPELMSRQWALSLPPQRAAQLGRDYDNLLKLEQAIAGAIPLEARDAYTEMVGFPARILGKAGLIFLADRKVRQGMEAAANEAEIARLRDEIKSLVQEYNTKIAGGKWSHMMPGLTAGKDPTFQVRWPWTEKPAPQQPAPSPQHADQLPAGQGWRDAAAADRQSAHGAARWCVVDGLGQTGRAVALKPTTLQTSWSDGSGEAPCLEFDFATKGGDVDTFIDFLPTFRIHPGMKLRVAVGVDDQPPTPVEVPGSSGSEDEGGPVRMSAVQNNYARLHVPLPGLAAGKHTFKIRAVDPGVVIDRISLPNP